MSPEVIVIAVGNRYRQDDGSALLVLDALADRLPATVRTDESDGDPARLIDSWAGVDLAIVVETVRGGKAAGTVTDIDGDLLVAASATSTREHGSHSLGILDAVALGRAMDRLPKRLLVVGIEPRDLGWGDGVSEPVAAGIGRAADLVLAHVLAGIDAPEPTLTHGGNAR